MNLIIAWINNLNKLFHLKNQVLEKQYLFLFYQVSLVLV